MAEMPRALYEETLETTNSQPPSQHATRFLRYVVITVGFLVSLMVYYSNPLSGLKGFIYNSDALYLPSLYADFIRGNDLSKWNLPPTPYFFPDMPLYFAIRVITPNIHMAAVLFGLIQLLMFALGLMLLSRHSLPHWYGSTRYSLIALMGVLFLVSLEKLEYYSQTIFVGTYHFGIVLMIPFVLAITLSLVRGSRTKAPLVWTLCALSFLTAVSDGWYLIQVTIPLIGSLAVLYLRGRVDSKRAFTVVKAVVPASLMGIGVSLVYVWKEPALRTYVFRPNSIYLSFLRLTDALATIPAYHIVLATIFISMCVFASLKSVARSLPHETFSTSADRASGLLPLYFLLSFALNVLTVIGLGVFADRNGFHYFIPLFIFSGFWGFPFVATVPKIIRPMFLERIVLGVLGLIALLALRSIDLQQIVENLTDTYYPPSVRCLDEKTAQLGIKYGVANYWQAKPISLLSQNDLMVVQVNRDLSPFYWINNPDWYKIRPEFAVIDLSLPENHPWRLDEDLIRNRFGEPDAIFQCEHSQVLVYNRPTSEFRDLFNDAP